MNRTVSYAVLLLTFLVVLVACNTESEPTQTLTVDFSGEGGGTVALNAPSSDASLRETFSGTYPVGETLLLTASADDNSVFTGWDGDCSDAGAPTCEVVLDADKEVRATFAKKTFTLKLVREGTGTGQILVTTGDGREEVCPTRCELDFAAGEAVTLTASAAQGATFTSWGQACSATAPTCTLTMDTSKTVAAVFDRVGATSFDLVVTKTGSGAVTSTPAGIGCGTDCRETYAKDTVVSLRATPDVGSSFAGWSRACSGTGPCTVTMNASKTVTATFAKQRVQLAVTLSGTGAGNVVSSPAGLNCPATCTASFAYGTDVVLSATPALGSSFAGWSGACSGTSCGLNLTADSSVTATFTPETGGTEKTVTATIIRGSDDAEQYLKAVNVKREKPAGTYESFSANAVDTKSGDIDLTFESDVVTTNQIIGLRFTDLSIPPGATILDAHIQFTIDHPTSGYVKVYFYGQANPSAPTFVHQSVNGISNRPKTNAVVPWEPAPWRSSEGTTNDPAALTVNLAPIVQEVVNLPGWQQGKNGLAFIVESDPVNGTNRRRATSFEDRDPNAKLIVTYRN